MKLTLTTKVIGNNGFWELRDQLNNFVRQNFDLLYEGAVRQSCNIPSDYYAGRRIQLKDTRLHEHQHLKYAHGHKYNEDTAPTAEQLRLTVTDIQSLLNSAGETIPAPFTISIVRSEK